MTTPILFREYIWLVNTIYKAKSISLSEINDKWVDTEMSGGVEFSRTTFHRHRIAIEEMFGINIDCDRRNGFRYYIGNRSVLQEDTVQNWMLSTLSVSSLLGESMSLNDRILLENIPSGGEKLQTLIKAMKESKKDSITHRRYGVQESKSFDIEPYCIKLFVRRWYLLGRFSDGRMATFSLDRIEAMVIKDEKFTMDEAFDASSYFSESYGVMVDEKMKPCRVVVRAYRYEPYYLRDLPLHASQREIKSTDEYCDFEMHLKPTSDFKAKLLSRGEWIEILEPKSLADEIIEWHQKAIDRYQKA